MSSPEWLSTLARVLKAQWVPPEEVRAEAWALGNRHQGRVAEGARQELQEPGLSARRTVLLKAVLRELRN